MTIESSLLLDIMLSPLGEKFMQLMRSVFSRNTFATRNERRISSVNFILHAFYKFLGSILWTALNSARLDDLRSQDCGRGCRPNTHHGEVKNSKWRPRLLRFELLCWRARGRFSPTTVSIELIALPVPFSRADIAKKVKRSGL